MPEDMPDKIPEDMSDRISEDLPVIKRINVMVGIIRSKVAFFWGMFVLYFRYFEVTACGHHFFEFIIRFQLFWRV